jgi:hypothetical protein
LWLDPIFELFEGEINFAEGGNLKVGFKSWTTKIGFGCLDNFRLAIDDRLFELGKLFEPKADRVCSVRKNSRCCPTRLGIGSAMSCWVMISGLESSRQLDLNESGNHSTVIDKHQIFAFLLQKSVFAERSVTIDYIYWLYNP